MFRKMDLAQLKPQNFTIALRKLCDELSAEGIQNYVHEGDLVTVTFFEPERTTYPIIDFIRGGIEFRGYNEAP